MTKTKRITIRAECGTQSEADHTLLLLRAQFGPAVTAVAARPIPGGRCAAIEAAVDVPATVTRIDPPQNHQALRNLTVATAIGESQVDWIQPKP